MWATTTVGAARLLGRPRSSFLSGRPRRVLLQRAARILICLEIAAHGVRHENVRTAWIVVGLVAPCCSCKAVGRS